MMDSGAAGATITCTRLLWRCYNQCKQAPEGFNNLHQDLLSLYQVLRAVESLSLPDEDLNPIYHGCEKVVRDVERHLSKHNSLGTIKKKPWQILRWSPADTTELRSRLTAQLTMLNVYVMIMQSPTLRSLGPQVQRDDVSICFSQSAESSDKDELIWSDIHQELKDLNASERLISIIKPLVLQRSTWITMQGPFKELPSDMASPLTYTNLTAVAANANNRQSSASCNASNRQSQATLSSGTSSATSSEREHITLSGTLRAKLSRPRRTLVAAAKGGDIITILKLINDKAQRFQLDRKSINEALIAVSSNEKREREQIEVIRLLLNRDAELEYRDDRYGRTPLIWAVSVGRGDIVDELLDRQALIEARDEDEDWTPLIWAVWWGNTGIINLLVNRGASLEAIDRKWRRTPLLWAAKRGTHEAAEVLLQKNRELIEVEDGNKLTPLALAYGEGHELVARVLIEYGADTNFKFESGLPLLVSAIMDGDEVFVRLLVENGANVDCKNKDGMSALSVAAKEEQLAVAEILINRGALLEAKDDQGRTALLWAVGRSCEDIVELLVNRGANTEAADNDGRTVWGWAMLTDNDRIIELVSE